MSEKANLLRLGKKKKELSLFCARLLGLREAPEHQLERKNFVRICSLSLYKGSLGELRKNRVLA